MTGGRGGVLVSAPSLYVLLAKFAIPILFYIAFIYKHMKDLFRDTKTGFESWIETLSPSEDQAFDRGFEAALLVVVEKCVDTKHSLLLKLLETDDEDLGQQLLAKVHMLDLVEKDLNKRIDVLDASVSLSPPL